MTLHTLACELFQLLFSLALLFILICCFAYILGGEKAVKTVSKFTLKNLIVRPFKVLLKRIGKFFS